MAFLTPALLGGIALVAIPIALHLIMRRQSQQFTFPAIRFVRERREANRRRMQLRHWLLLALRCLLIAALAVALARPTLRATGLQGKEGNPLGIAAVIDNSLRMQYVRNNRTRLEEAVDLASQLIAKLPDDAAAAVCDRGRAVSGFAPDLSAAAARLQNLRPSADVRPLVDAVVEAIGMTAEQKDRRPEVFVFTDLSETQWSDEAIAKLDKALADFPEVRLYVVDVGVESPQNASLAPLEIRRSVLRPGEPLHVQTIVASNMKGEPPLVELSLQNEEGQLEKRGQQIAVANSEGQATVSFDVADLTLGTHQGAIELSAPDPLTADNVRYFTVEVRPAAEVLLAAERAADARLVSLAIAPEQPAASGRFKCTITEIAKLADESFDKYQAILLLDPGKLSDDVSHRLWEFASAGGGVGIFLGHNADFKALNAEAPQRLLPGKLLRISREETYLRPRRLDHPALLALRNFAESIPWPDCKVFAFWQFEQLASDAYIVASFANDEPAIVERPAGRGRLIAMTTPISDPLEPEGREAWNVLPATPWPFVALIEELVGYLAQDADERLDYVAGEIARLRLTARDQIANYVLRLPDGQAETRVAPTGESDISVGVTEMLGNYRLTAGGRAQRLDRGFSVNCPAEVSDLTRADPAGILEQLPADRVRLSNNLDDVLELVDVGRSGRELYPWVIGLVACVWAGEHLLANRFYRRPGEVKTLG